MTIVSENFINQRLQLHRSRTEIVAFNILIPFLSLVSMAICFLPKYGLIPSWIVCLLNIALTSQIVALTHELMHEPSSETKWNYFLKLNFHVYSPFTVGFEEYKRLHALHHMNENTDKDPDYFMVKGGRLRSLLLLAFAPEYWFFYVLKNKQTQNHFWIFYCLRILLLICFVFNVGFLAYLALFFVPSKLSYGLSFLIFSHEAHTNELGERKGTYNLSLSWSFITKLLKIFVGPYGFNIAFNHANHHLYPWVSGRKLGLITQEEDTASENKLLNRQLI